MNRIFTGFCCFCLVLLLMLGAQAQKVRVLVVTVDRYKDPDVRSFIKDGEQRDGEYIKLALQGVLKQRTLEFTELSTDKSTTPERFATQKHIMDALSSLKEKAQSGDAVVVYFSGHGSRKGDHFSLCPYDASPTMDGNDITDVQLASWANDLTTKTDNLTLILDCCFSSYATKDPFHRPKFLARGPMSDTAALASVFPQDKVVVLKASRTDEEAQEEEDNGAGKWVGVFTKWLCLEMKKPNANTLTYAQLMQFVDTDIKNELTHSFHNSFSQTPQIDGSPEQQNRLLFQPIPRQPVAIVPPHLNISAPQNGKVELNAGSPQKVTKGSEYAVYSKSSTTFDQVMGKIRVTDVRDSSATAEVVEEHGIQAGDFAVEKKHVEPQADTGAFKLRVEASGNLKSTLESALRATQLVQISEDKPSLLLHVESQNNGLMCRLYRMETPTVPEKTALHEASVASSDALVQQMRPWLQNLTFLHSLVGLNNTNPGITIKINLEKAHYHIGDRAKMTLDALDAKGAHVDCYITLIDIDANGAPSIIFPIKSAPTATLSNNLLTAERQFTLSIARPAGQEILIAIATLKPSDWGGALSPSGANSGVEIHSKGVSIVANDIQERPLEEWAKSIVTFFIDP